MFILGPVALFDTRRLAKFMKENCTRKVLPESFKDVSPKKRDDNSWLKYTLVLVAITPQLGPLLVRPSVQVSFGPRPEQTHMTSYSAASDASF